MRNEVFELANQVSNFKDVYNRYPWEHVADCLSQHWNFVNFTEHKCPKCKNQLISMVYQTNNGHYDKPEVLYICTSCQSQYDSDIKILQNSHLIDQEYIKKVNPFTFELVTQLESIGCIMTFHKDAGDYGVILFEYRDETLGLWIDETYAINIFYPNWKRIASSDLSDEIISTIQKFNLNNNICVYWLFDDNYYTFSSNTFIDINSINKTLDIEELLSKLIDSKSYFTQSFNTNAELKGSTISVEILHGIETTLESCGCKNIELDDENDIHFNWNGNSLYLHVLDDRHCKIFSHMVMLEDVAESGKQNSDGVDMTALSIQWSNMIWPIKCSFYKPDDYHTSITATVCVELSHLSCIHQKFVSRRLNELVAFYDNSLCDLLLGTENGCRILEKYYQPSINNYDIIRTYSDIREVPQEIINKSILLFKEQFTLDCQQKYGSNFEWIERIINLTAPHFHLFCFRIEQCVFSCRVAIIDDDVRFDNGTWQFKLINYDNYCGNEERLKICKDNNLVPCVIVIDIKNRQIPAFAFDEGDALVPFEIDEYISENKLMTTLSKYEIRIMSRSVILDYIKKRGFILQAVSQMPAMQPAIYCSQSESEIAIIDDVIINQHPIKADISTYNIMQLISQNYRVIKLVINILSEKLTKGESVPVYRGDKVFIEIDSVNEINDSEIDLRDNSSNENKESTKNKHKLTIQAWIKKAWTFVKNLR